MGALVGRVLKWAIPTFLPIIINWLVGKVTAWNARRRANAEIRARAKAAREQTEAAQTKEQRDAATDSLRDNW